MLIIGLTGRAGSGKSTFANVLKDKIGAVEASFAKPLRDVSEAVFGSRFETQEEKARFDAYWASRLGHDWATGRLILQRLGTDIFRKYIHEDIWLMAMERHLAQLQGTAAVVVIPDVRFDNEASLVHAWGGSVIRLINARHPVGATDLHPTEAGISMDMVDETYSCMTAAFVEDCARRYAIRLQTRCGNAAG